MQRERRNGRCESFAVIISNNNAHNSNADKVAVRAPSLSPSCFSNCSFRSSAAWAQENDSGGDDVDDEGKDGTDDGIEMAMGMKLLRMMPFN